MNKLQEIKVSYTDDCVELRFIPHIPVPVAVNMPLPLGRADYTVDRDFPHYGNSRLKIKNEVFVAETAEQYIERFAHYLGSCVITPEMKFIQ